MCVCMCVIRVSYVVSFETTCRQVTVWMCVMVHSTDVVSHQFIAFGLSYVSHQTRYFT